MSRKVVILGPYPPPYGGVSIYIQTLFEFLKGRNVEFWLFGDKEMRAPHVFFMKDKRRELVPLLLRRGARARIVDCTHFLIEYPSSLVPVWIALKNLLGFEWIKIMQDGSLPTRYAAFGPTRRALFRLATRVVTEFIVISEELEDWLRKEVKVKQPVTLIKNLFPISYSESEPALPSEIKTALVPYEERSKRACSIGVFIPQYGFAHVAVAVEKIRNETGTDIGLLLLDGDFAADDSYRSEVLSGREWITVLKNIPHSLVFPILRRSDVFVRACGLDGYGLSRVEAIWCGLPVVATRAGETRGMLLYDFGDIDELTRQLQQALSGQQVGAVNEWAAVYQREAEENLAALVKKIGLG